MLEILINVISAGASTVAFAIYFNAPKKSLIYCAIVGIVGWISYYLLVSYVFGSITSNLISAILIAVLSEYFSTKLRMPSTVFIYTGIFMIVPGYAMYHTMEYFANENYLMAFEKGYEAFGLACAIAIGVLIASTFSKSIRRYKQTKHIFNKK